MIQRAVNLNFDWDGIEDLWIFKTCLENKKINIGGAINGDWEKDEGEKAT